MKLVTEGNDIRILSNSLSVTKIFPKNKSHLQENRDEVFVSEKAKIGAYKCKISDFTVCSTLTVLVVVLQYLVVSI